MKLRLRSIESKETLKIEAPNPCTLPQLKQILSQKLPDTPSPASIRLSLNRKDELQSDGEQSLHSLGIAAGDLIFFSLEHPAVGASSNSADGLPLPKESASKSVTFENSEYSTSLNTVKSFPDAQNSETVVSESHKGETLDVDSKMEETMDEMEVDDERRTLGSYSYGTDGSSSETVGKSFSVPGFLRKVFVEELGDNGGRDHKLVVIAVHAVMLEAGFVGYDKNANVVVNGFQLRDEWPSALYRLSLYYTLQESVGVDSEAIKKTVVLKFQSLGKFIYVYGTLQNGSGKKGTYSVQLNEDQLVPFLNVVWANCGVKDSVAVKDGDFSSTSPEKEVFNFWKTVKDNLALPLLIDLCEESGLELPPCFMRLPTDLKLKILESVSGVDLAKVSCVCSELRYLGSNDDLWKLKFKEEFGNELKEAQGRWKQAFVTSWNLRSTPRKIARVRAPYWPAPYWAQPWRRRYPNPFMVPRVPRIIGGDYDIGPGFADDSVPNRLLDSVNHPMRSFSPPCNLGVRGGRFD